MKTLEMTGVSVIKNGKKILDSIDLSIEHDENVAIIGNNGSGKTTLIKLLRKDILPYYDEKSPSVIKIFGEEYSSVFDIRNRIGIVSMDLQSRFAGETTVAEVIASGFFGSLDVFRNMDITADMVSKIRDAAVMMGIEDLLDRRTEGLSLGEMRRALIARALAPGPGTLVMDEPMTGLDISMSTKFRKMFDILMKAGINLIMVTHDLADIPDNIHRIIMMKDGRIFADGRKDDLLTSEIMSELYGEPIKVEYHNGTYRMHL